MRVRTVVVGGVAVVVAVVLALPGWTGVRTEAAVRALAQSADRPGVLRVRVVDYRRGWFSSRALIRVTVTPAPEPGQPRPKLTFDLAERIGHGPFPLADRAGAHLGWRPVQAVIHTAWVTDAASRAALGSGFPARPLEAVTVISPAGGAETELRMPAWRAALKLRGSADARLDWGGARGRIAWSRDFGRIDQRYRLAGFDIQGVRGTVRMGSMIVVGHSRRAPSGLMTGTMKVRVAGLEVGSGAPARPAFAMTGVVLDGSSAEHDGAVTVTGGLRIARIRAAGLELGPAEYRLRVAPLDAATLVRLQADIRRIQTRGGDAQQVQRRVLRLVLAQVPALLRRSPELDLERLSLVTPDGEIRLHARVKFTPAVLSEPSGLWWRGVAGEAALQIPVPLLRAGLLQQARAQLRAARRADGAIGPGAAAPDDTAALLARQRLHQLQAQGLIACAGGTCRSSVTFDAGRVNVNGRMLPMPQR